MPTAADKTKIRVLERALTLGREAYYNSDKDLMTDAQFDKLEDQLRKLDPTNKFFKKTGAAPKGKAKVKIKLPYPMPSLNKMRPENGEVESWLKENKGPYTVTEKLDGSSLQLGYEGKNAYTRGDGIIGKDISYMFDHFKIPKKSPYPDLRCEAMMQESVFLKKYKSEENKTSRGTANGALNKSAAHPVHKDITIVVHEVLNPRGVPSQQLTKLKAAGFTVPWFKVYTKLDSVLLSNLLKERKKKSDFALDGLVVAQDIKTPLAKTIPQNKIAFKENVMVEAEVLSVAWTLSKHGMWKPVVQIKPMDIGGVKVKQATGFNAKFIYDNKIGKGARVSLTRSGEVIPHIVSVIKKAAKPDMPKGEWEWNKTKVDAVIKNAGQDDDVRIKRLVSFFATCGVENLGPGIIEKLYEEGYDKAGKIIRMTISNWRKIPGFKDTSAAKLHGNVLTVMQNIDLATLADATGLFGRGFGTRKFQALLDAYPNPRKLIGLPNNAVQSKLTSIEGFSDTTATLVVVGLPKFYKWLDSMEGHIKVKSKIKVAPKGYKLKGHSVAFTGFRDKALAAAIVEQGGEATDSMNSGTTILLALDPNGGSSKIAKARAKGVKIMTAEKFRLTFGIK